MKIYGKRFAKTYSSSRFKKGIYFSGALRLDDWNIAGDALLFQFKRLCEHRNEMIELIAKSEDFYSVNPSMTKDVATIPQTSQVSLAPTSSASTHKR